MARHEHGQRLGSNIFRRRKTMKPSSGTLAFIRVFVCVVAIVAAVGYYGHVRAQSTDARGQIILPLRPMAPLSSVPVPPVFGMDGILADKTAAIALGKALFWDMQAGSDDVQACASCHFNAGADSRPANTLNPGQAGGDNNFDLGPQVNGVIGPNHFLNPGTPGAGFGGYHDGDYPFRKMANADNRGSTTSDLNDVAGSQGVFATNIVGVTVNPGAGAVRDNTGQTGSGVGGGAIDDVGDDAGFTRGPGGQIGPDRRPGIGGGISGNGNQGASGTTTNPGQLPNLGVPNSVETTSWVADPVFSYPDPADAEKRVNTRKVTGRNTPSAVNAVFNFRNFWDGRAQNVCNGNNPFGARDGQAHLVVADAGSDKVSPAFVAMKNSALCSQALGPILSSVEMSADGRDFRQVGKKMLVRTPLAKQLVDPADSVLGLMSNAPDKGLKTSYQALIQKAFQPEWWRFQRHLCVAGDGTVVGSVNPAQFDSCPAGTFNYTQMEYNFSLFWGVAIQMYESTLIADQTPLDRFLEQQKTFTLTGDNAKQFYTIQLPANIDPLTLSVIELDPHNDFSDAEVYAFDDGYGAVGGEGITQGTIDYASGTLKLFFDVPPRAPYPIRINYSVGPTALTPGQLRGLLLFNTKGRCVVCHGGPELSNAAVDTVTPNPLERMVQGDLSIRVYDTGYYHIGVRPGVEDAGLAGADPVAGLPLSNGEFQRQRVCKDSSLVMMIPGRPGDGITQAPLNCGDDIARTGFFKAPQLRNIALTAPYFHNGSQLTLEQVVEFYNRGGDFNSGAELKIMDPDIDRIGFTLQEKQDLVDFLRNGLTDPRTVAQAAPFDHPELVVPFGHVPGANGYPVQKDPNHPGQAADGHIQIPAVGKNGGKPFPTFLENALKLKNGGSNQ
jgi:cytochrome c peroxidase